MEATWGWTLSPVFIGTRIVCIAGEHTDTWCYITSNAAIACTAHELQGICGADNAMGFFWCVMDQGAGQF